MASQKKLTYKYLNLRNLAEPTPISTFRSLLDVDELTPEWRPHGATAANVEDSKAAKNKHRIHRHLTNLVGVVSAPIHNDHMSQTIGFISAVFIDRAEMMSGTMPFQRQMKSIGHSFWDLAYDVFEQHGNVKDEIVEHPVRKGSGVWRDELSNGALLYIDLLVVADEWRHKGIGKKLIKDIIEFTSTEEMEFQYVLTRPHLLTFTATLSQLKLTTTQNSLDIAISVFRSANFRRVGRTAFFGFAIDEKHPSHSLLAACDAEDLETYIRRMTTPVTPHLLPGLLKMVSTSNQDYTIGHRLKMTEYKAEEYLAKDPYHRNVLHLAVIKERSLYVGQLLANPNVHKAKLLEDMDVYGDTPLDINYRKIQMQKDKTEAEGKKFYPSKDLITIERYLKGDMKMPRSQSELENEPPFYEEPVFTRRTQPRMGNARVGSRPCTHPTREPFPHNHHDLFPNTRIQTRGSSWVDDIASAAGWGEQERRTYERCASMYQKNHFRPPLARLEESDPDHESTDIHGHFMRRIAGDFYRNGRKGG